MRRSLAIAAAALLLVVISPAHAARFFVGAHVVHSLSLRAGAGQLVAVTVRGAVPLHEGPGVTVERTPAGLVVTVQADAIASDR